MGIGKREPIEVTLDIVHSRSTKLFLAAAAPVKRSKVKACLCLHSTVSTLWDCSTCLTVHSLADLFIPIPFVLIWESGLCNELVVYSQFCVMASNTQNCHVPENKKKSCVGYGLSEEFKVNIGLRQGNDPLLFIIQ